jgi:hypothetical protein
MSATRPSFHEIPTEPTGAIHVYGGDFFGAERSEWDPETLKEGRYPCLGEQPPGKPGPPSLRYVSPAGTALPIFRQVVTLNSSEPWICPLAAVSGAGLLSVQRLSASHRRHLQIV